MPMSYAAGQRSRCVCRRAGFAGLMMCRKIKFELKSLSHSVALNALSRLRLIALARVA